MWRNDFADLCYLFTYSFFLLPGGLSGKQLWTTISCPYDVTAGKEKGS